MFSGEVLTLNEIVRYYSLSKESLIFLMNRILTGKSDILSEFIGYTEDELKEEFKRLQCEVEKCAVFNILTTLEAEFRMDFFIRVKRKYKFSITGINILFFFRNYVGSFFSDHKRCGV